jgi:hypothetical protein
MIALPALEKGFQDFLLDRPSNLPSLVRRSAKADEATLLNVYHNAYKARLVEVLASDYPTVLAMLGAATFAAMARAYVAAYPSRHYSARWVGAALTAFLGERQPYAGEPALGEMAAFEWAQAGAFDAADIEPLTFAQLTNMPPEAWATLKFRFGPSLRCLSLNFDVPALWLAVSREEASEPPLRAAPRAADWLIWRAGLEVRFRALEPAEAWALDAARDGADFAAICEGICRWIDPEEAAFKAAELIKGWVDSSLVDDAVFGNLAST